MRVSWVDVRASVEEEQLVDLRHVRALVEREWLNELAFGSKGVSWWRFDWCMFETESEESGRECLVAWFVPSMTGRGGE